jgi:hypothetical protein
MSESETETVHIRLERAELDRLDLAAREQYRSRSNTAALLIKQGLRRLGVPDDAA